MLGAVRALLAQEVPIPPQIVDALVNALGGLLSALGVHTGNVRSTQVDSPPSVVELLSWLGSLFRVDETSYLGRLWDWLTSTNPAPVARLQTDAFQARSFALAHRTELSAPDIPAEVTTSPGIVQGRTEVRRLAGDVARLGVWQHGHGVEVHGGIAREWPELRAAAQAFAAMVAATAADLPDAIDVVVSGVIPKEVDRVLGVMDRVADHLEARDAALADRIHMGIDDLRSNLRDLEHLLTDRVVPDVLDRIDAERAARRQADRALEGSVATTQAGLQTQVAGVAALVGALAATVAGDVSLATDKVMRTEPIFDALLSNGLGTLFAFTSFPALVALLTKLAPRVVQATPEVLSGLEGAAARVLGSVG